MWCWAASLLDYLVTLIIHCWVLGKPSVFCGWWRLEALGSWFALQKLSGWDVWVAVEDLVGGGCKAAGLPTTITICLRNGGFLLHKVSFQTTPSLGFFVSGANSVFAVNCSDIMLCSAIGGHPQVGALRSLKQWQAPRNVSMVHLVIQLQQRNRIKSGWCS
jgi:hypothetical protein